MGFNSAFKRLRCCATNRKVAGSIPASINGFVNDIKSFRSHYGPGVDSSSNRNKYREYFLGVKSGRCVRLTTLPPSCAVVTKSRTLNFLEPSGHLRPVIYLYALFHSVWAGIFFHYLEFMTFPDNMQCHLSSFIY